MAKSIRFQSKLMLAGLLPLLLCAQTREPASLKIDAATVKAKVSPLLYGLMTEEINFSYDGGLYAELIRNRAVHSSWEGPVHWTLVTRGHAQAAISVDAKSGPSAALTQSLKLHATVADASSPAGVENEGYWGIPVRPDTTYRGSFYGKADQDQGSPVTVSLVNDTTGAVAASAQIAPLGTAWKRFEFVLKTGPAPVSADNHFVMSVEKPGQYWFDLVSLMPPTYHDRPNGNRIDLMEKLAEMHPAFLRMPGGNYLEGDHIADRFEWKKTIGPLVDRPTHPSPWRYQSSDGMGLLEFLEWCEDLRMQPLLAVYAGYSLAQDHVAPGPSLEPFVQDALDEIEYVTGGADTKWGAVRIRDGHAAPFPLHFVEIGNEDAFDKSGSYDGRFAQFAEAIRKKYPALRLIATAPVKTGRPDLIDDHFYRSAEQFFADTHHYDQTDRDGPKILVGEWATREGSPTPDFNAALGDAAWMTGLERNSDVVLMASYAPLLVNVNPGGMQWSTDLIGYDALTSYGSPSYYAQVMFGAHRGDEVLASRIEGAGPRFFYSVTRDATRHTIILKGVNASSDPQDLAVEIAGLTSVKRQGTLTSMAATTPNETNTLRDPARIVPTVSALPGFGKTFRHTFPPYSIQILEWSAD